MTCQTVIRQASDRLSAGHPESFRSRERTYSASASDRGAGNEKCEWRRESEKNGFPCSIAQLRAQVQHLYVRWVCQKFITDELFVSYVQWRPRQ